MKRFQKKTLLPFLAFFLSLANPVWSQVSAEGAKFLAAIPSSSLGSPFGAGSRSVPKVFAPRVPGYDDQTVIDGEAFSYEMIESKTKEPVVTEDADGGQYEPGTSGFSGQSSRQPAGCGPHSRSIKCMAVFARCVIGSFYVNQYQIANPEGIEGALPPATLQDKLCPQSPEYYLKKAQVFSRWFLGL